MSSESTPAKPMKLQKYAFFNHHLKDVYPFAGMPKRSVKGGWCFLVDVSGSMMARKRTLERAIDRFRTKMGATALDMPYPDSLDGGTALADAAVKFAGKLKTATFVVITDGEDWHSEKHFNFPLPNWRRGRPSKKYINERRAAVLEHLEKTLKAQIVLLGMGDGAKKLIRAASRAGRRINCAFVDDTDALEDIDKVVDCAVDATERTKDGRKARVITAKSLGGLEYDEFWDEDDDMDGFIASDEEESDVEGSDDEGEDDDGDESSSDSDSDALCDDDSDDEAPAAKKGKKRAAPAPASNRAKRASAAKASYVDSGTDSEGSDSE